MRGRGGNVYKIGAFRPHNDSGHHVKAPRIPFPARHDQKGKQSSLGISSRPARLFRCHAVGPPSMAWLSCHIGSTNVNPISRHQLSYSSRIRPSPGTVEVGKRIHPNFTGLETVCPRDVYSTGCFTAGGTARNLNATPMESVLILHQRVSANGLVRIVAVQCDPSLRRREFNDQLLRHPGVSEPSTPRKLAAMSSVFPCLHRGRMTPSTFALTIRDSR